jgi:hypothetical protein
MVIEGDALWALLHELDDPQHLEHPADYDHAKTRALFDELVRSLDLAFDCACDADRYVQDASHHGRVVIPAHATATGQNLVVTISNFGQMATVSVDNPGSYDRVEFDALLDRRDADLVDALLSALGYRIVSEEPLWTRYNGPSPIDCDGEDLGVTWWTRFFDYL